MRQDFFLKLMQEQLQQQINLFQQAACCPSPQGGWIKSIRRCLGMSAQYLAERLGYRQSHIAACEKREAQGTLTINTLKEMAEALDCQLVYGFVPRKPLKELLEEQAKKVVRQQLGYLNHSMQLEQQGLTSQQAQRNEQLLVEDLLKQSPRKLWGEK